MPVSHLVGVRCPALGLGVVVIKVSCVGRATQMWDNRTRQSPVVHCVPVNLAEPWMALDGARTALDVAESFRDIDIAETADNVARLRRHG